MAAPDTELAFTSALELAAMIRSRALSPVELVELYLGRIERLDPVLGSFITVAADQARAAARQAEAEVTRAGVAAEDLPPFHGVPVSVKDLIDTAGIRTTYATAAWSQRVPTADAWVIHLLKRAGFIILGKTSTPEFAGGIFTEPAAYGPCRNPWNTDFTPGGSSGGAGASQAAGLCAAALGSDDGGSVRIPSGWCGLFGIKPARGRVSAAPEPSAPYYTPGPLAHSVADAAAILDVIGQPASGDGFWAPPHTGSFLDETGRDPGRLRIAYTTNAADGVTTTAPNRAAVEQTARTLEGLGHDLYELEDWPGRGTFPDNRTVGLHVIYGAMLAMKIDQGLAPPVESMEFGQQILVALGREVKGTDLLWAQYVQAEASRQIVAAFDDFDVLLTPVVAAGPSRVGEFVEHPERLLGMLDVVQFTGQWSITGQPAASVPALLDDDGVPVGIQLVGRPADEATLIRLSSQLEQAQPWTHRRPAVS